MAQKPKAVPFAGLFAAIAYGIISISITFFNKAVLSVYDFHYPNIMTLFQMSFSLFLLVVSKHFKLVDYPDFEWATAKRIAPLAISFIGMVLTGLAALGYLNIPMFSALRRVTTLITLYAEFFLLGKAVSTDTKLSVWLMVFGALFAGYYDLGFNAMGYTLVAINCAFTAGYLVCIAKFGKGNLNNFGLMFYNNLLSLPIVVLICYFGGDFDTIQDFEYLYDARFLACFIIQACLAFFLNYSIFLCTSLNSALTTSVTGQIKNILTTLGGYFMFGDVKYEFFNVVGLLIGIVSSLWYSHIKFTESQNAKKKTILPLSEKSSGHVHSK